MPASFYASVICVVSDKGVGEGGSAFSRQGCFFFSFSYYGYGCKGHLEVDFFVLLSTHTLNLKT